MLPYLPGCQSVVTTIYVHFLNRKGEFLKHFFVLADIDTFIKMPTTKSSTYYRSIVLVLLMVFWVSLETAAKDEEFSAIKNNIKGKRMGFVSLSQTVKGNTTCVKSDDIYSENYCSCRR